MISSMFSVSGFVRLFHARQMASPKSNAPLPTTIPITMTIRLFLLELSPDCAGADDSAKQYSYLVQSLQFSIILLIRLVPYIDSQTGRSRVDDRSDSLRF